MHDLDSLLKRASSHYLQGNVEAALEAWKGVLRLAPGNERAVEGVRMCQQVLAARGTAAGASLEDVEEAFSELDEKLDLGESASATAEADLDLQWSLSGDSDGEIDRQARHEPGEALPTTGSAPAWSWNADLGESEPAEAPLVPAAEMRPPTPAPPPIATAATSEMELRRRANELLANALVAMEAGNDDEARRTLDRVLILDESNEAARQLKEKIAAAQRNRPSVAAPAPRMAAEPAAAEMRPLELAPIDLDPGIARREAVTEPPLGEIALAAAPAAEDGAEAPDLADVAAPARSELEKPARPSALGAVLEPGFRRWMVIASLLAVCAAAFYVFRGGGSAASESEAEGEAVAAGAGLGGKQPRRPGAGRAPSSEASGAPEAPAANAAVDVAVDVPATLARGDAAFAAGQYSDAILAYNAVLKVEPANAAARAGLKQAGDVYRKQREAQEQWVAAQQAFREENFQEALRQFYRMDRPEDAELIQRYKVDGWYNLGVIALRAGDCPQAQANFKDAREVQGSDAGLADAMKLAHSCAKDAQFREQVAALSLRSPAG